MLFRSCQAFLWRFSEFEFFDPIFVHMNPSFCPQKPVFVHRCPHLPISKTQMLGPLYHHGIMLYSKSSLFPRHCTTDSFRVRFPPMSGFLRGVFFSSIILIVVFWLQIISRSRHCEVSRCFPRTLHKEKAWSKWVKLHGRSALIEKVH